MERNEIAVSVTVHAPLEKVWNYWTDPEHIIGWNNASADWHTPRAVNNLSPGGTFNYRMESKDGKIGFDFEGTYQQVVPKQYIAYHIADGRKVSVIFEEENDLTVVSEVFEPEEVNPAEMQREGWQAILNNFKKYTENN